MTTKMEICIVVGLYNIILFYVFSRLLLKALGFFTYDTEEAREEYAAWLEKEGVYRSVVAVVILIFLVIESIWFFSSLK